MPKLAPSELHDALTQNDVTYFCGVPDSTLSAFGHYLGERADGSHDIAVNEGNAIGLAIGYHIASSNVPVVYMQNSGLGNAINPLTSLADPLVMGIPMILLIGWRGQPGRKDEPQHAKQGLITISLLDSLGIVYEVLSADSVATQIARITGTARETNQPVALLVEPEAFEPYTLSDETLHAMSRETAVQTIAASIGKRDVIVSTTGKASRELFEYRERTGSGHSKDLLIVGGMGHASVVAYGIAKQQPTRNIFVIDGDGAALMHLGALPFIGSYKPKNLYHFVINNGAHESVGGQPTVARTVDLTAIALAAGYREAYTVFSHAELKKTMASITDQTGPVLVEVITNTNSRPDLTRPTISPVDNKRAFMEFLEKD